MATSIEKLSQWYNRQCVDEWEEEYGLTINTLDNPGWMIKIDLNNTNLESKSFSEVQIERSDNDWIVARKVNDKFEAFGGPLNLEQMIEIFLDWACSEKEFSSQV